MDQDAGWRGAAQRLWRAVESGLASFALFSGVPWPDLPTNQGWTFGPDNLPALLPMSMDSGPSTPPDSQPALENRGARPLSAAECEVWQQIRDGLRDLEGSW